MAGNRSEPGLLTGFRSETAEMVLDARLATEDPAGVSSAIHRGGRRSVTKQAVPYRRLQPIVGEKSGPTLRAGRLAATALAEASNGVIVSVFRSAANLLLDTGRLVALLPLWRALHPWAVSGMGLSENVHNGMSVQIKDGVLSLGDIELRLGRIRIHDLSLTKKLSVVTDDTIRKLRVVVSVSEQEDPLSQVALSCLEQCREAGDVSLVATALGVGGGLTPSGDDVLVGLLAALDLMSEESCVCRNDQLQTKPGTVESSEGWEAVIREEVWSTPSRLRRILVSALPESLHEHTTLLSAQMIEAAMVGCYPEPVVTLGGSLAQPDAPWAKVERAAKRVTEMGHGSGSAMLRGFIVGLEFGLAQK